MPTDPHPCPDADPMPQPPPWPDDEACCGQGCEPCIYDLHALAQEGYLAALAAWQARHPAPPTGARPT